MDNMSKMSKINTDPPAGTRDFLPEDMVVRNWLFDAWTRISKKFGFQQYDCPIVEYQNLYTRKANDDIINEMFAFDLGNNKLTLRSEMTPSLARMMMKFYKTAPSPFKMFSIAQCWRFEDIKRGRKREHYQWNVDIFDGEKIITEIEVLSIIVAFFEEIKLSPNDVVVKISNRMILQKILLSMNVQANLFDNACIIIDKMEKKSRVEISAMLKTEIGLNDDQVDILYALCAVRNIDDIANFLGDTDETFVELKAIFEISSKIGILPWLEFDASIVRGLSYYTGIVFECFPRNLPTLQKSICGGGQYDNLMTTYGYEKTIRAIGFGFGDVVIIELLRDLNKLPIIQNETKYLVVAYKGFSTEALVVCKMIHATGTNAEIYTGKQTLSKAYSYANRKQIDNVILIAPNEWRQNEILLKRLRDNTKNNQVVMPLVDFINGL